MAGSLLLLLHAHLPWVRHPEHPDFLEEDWLYEAVAESYLPLLEVFDRLTADRVGFRVTMTLTPTLLAMLQDDLLMDRCARRLARQEEFGDRESERTRHDPALHALARFHRDFYAARLADFEARGRRLLPGLLRHADEGRLELLTSAATHAFLPLLQDCPEAVKAQLAIGREAHARALGREPRGIWLPECGYVPGLEVDLAAEGLRSFFLESHGLLWSSPPAPGGVHLPAFTASGVAAFARDPEASAEVWSSEVGYPGHPDYRELHRDVAFELPWEDVAPWMIGTGVRRAMGYRYWRVTGGEREKARYEPRNARARAQAHARHFVGRRREQLARLVEEVGPGAVVVAPYDAELFGHWWFEGPDFLEAVFRELAALEDGPRAVTPSGYLESFSEQALVTPAASSWGREGSAATWLDPSNDWLYGKVNACAERLVARVACTPAPTPLQERALAQAGRELLLAQSSDWAFILRAGTSAQYAEARVSEHLEFFTALLDGLDAGAMDLALLEAREAKVNLFPWLRSSAWAPAVAQGGSPPPPAPPPEAGGGPAPGGIFG